MFQSTKNVKIATRHKTTKNALQVSKYKVVFACKTIHQGWRKSGMFMSCVSILGRKISEH